LENGSCKNAYLDGCLYITLCVLMFLSLIFRLKVTRFLPLLVPHMISMGFILATYPYPSKTDEDPISAAQSIPAPQGATEGSVPWQVNIQGIQNLMGAT